MPLRPVWELSEAELLAEAQAINKLDDQAALRDPCALMRHLLPAYRRRAHLRLIGREMARLHRGDGDRLMVLTPPQVGKTVTAVVGGAFWWLALHRMHRVIIGSYGNTLAINRGRSIRRLVTEHGHRYDLAVARGSAGVADWELDSGGGVKSVGIGAGVTGSPGDFGLIDDPHKSRADADSLRRRDTVHDWYSADFTSRLAPGAPVVLIMTPWHPDDLAARLLRDEGDEGEGGRWRVVRIPALCTDPDTDPLGRAPGEPMPHPKIRANDKARALAHWEEKRAGSALRDWFALYQCDPRPVEGALLSRALLRERRCYVKDSASGPCADRLKAAVSVDPSGGGRDTAGIVAGYLGVDRRLYLTDDRSGHMGSDAWARTACQLAVDVDADRIICEKNYGGDMVQLAIRTAWDALRREELYALGADETAAAYQAAAKYNRHPPRIVPVRAKVNKLLRAEPIAQQWVEDRIRTAAYLPDVEEEWATWQPDHTDSPGRIDASVYLAYGLLPPPGSGGRGAAPPSGSLPTTGASPLGQQRGGATTMGPLGGPGGR